MSEEQDKLRENRLGEQAALILTMNQLLKKIVNKNNPSTTAENKMYKNFIPVRYENKAMTPTGHSFITSNFTKTPSMNTFFNNLPPNILSFLIPSIKIYKTFYPFPSEDGKEGKLDGYDWRVPFDNVPMRYEKETSEFVVQDIDKVLNGNGGLRNAAIKSFSYEYKGVNPAEINTNIYAKLELFFQSPAELIKRINFDLSDARFVKRPNNSRDADKEVSFSYSDLINQSSRTIKDNATGQSRPDDQYYRLKIECGYADIQPNILNDTLENFGYSLESRNEIINAIQNTKVVLFVSPYQYNVQFNDDSTVNLIIEFHASMDTIMTSQEADIFMLTEESKKINKLVKDFNQFLDLTTKEQKLGQQETEENYKCLDIEEIKNSIENFKIQYNLGGFTDDEIKQRLSEEKAKAYNSLASFLVGREKNFYSVDAEMAKKLITPQVYIGLFKPEILGISSEKDKNTTKQRIEAFQNGDQVMGVLETVGDNFTNLKIADQNLKFDKDKPTDITEKPLKDLEFRQKAYSNAGDRYNIPFVLMGDILDIALDCLNQITPLQDAPKIVIGSIPINIPKQTSEIIQAGNNISVATEEIFPNLADIPISYNLFQEFLIKNIVKANKTRYPLLQFIKDIISELVKPAILPSVFGQKAAINSAVRFSTSYFTFPTENGKDLLANNENADKRSFLSPLNEEIVNKLNNLRERKGVWIKNPKPEEEAIEMPPFVNYMFIFCSTKFPRNLKGKEDDDINKGVFHIRMGTDTGIVKKINFSKVNIPYQREMKAHIEGNHQGTSLKQFYNAEIEMFGNDIFRPGDYIYIHPNYSFIRKQENKESSLNQMGGFGGMESRVSNTEKRALERIRAGSQYIDLQDSLGIGGYYLVIDVKTDISIANYSTKIKCSYQAQVIGDKVLDINDRCPDKR